MGLGLQHLCFLKTQFDLFDQAAGCANGLPRLEAPMFWATEMNRGFDAFVTPEQKDLRRQAIRSV